MRTLYQSSPWQAATSPVARSQAFGFHAPTRLGDPSGYFAGEPFMPVGGPRIPSRSVILAAPRRTLAQTEQPIEGVNITRPVCRCKFGNLQRDSSLGQGCSRPTGGGGSGSATFDGNVEPPTSGQGVDVGTIALVGVGGVAALFLLGIL